MTKEELRELIQNLIHEYMGTGSSGGNSTDGNDIPSQRIGGEFFTDEEEKNFYNDRGAPYGGAEGNHYRKEKDTSHIGYRQQKYTRY